MRGHSHSKGLQAIQHGQFNHPGAEVEGHEDRCGWFHAVDQIMELFVSHADESAFYLDQNVTFPEGLESEK